MVQHIQLKDICDVLNGYAFKSSKYVDAGIRVIRITNVQKGYIEDDAPQYYPLESKKEIEKYLLREDDLLMSLTGNVGRVAILKKEMLPAALNQRVACLRLKKSANVYKPYLFHLLNSDFFENQCIFSAQGIAQKNMSTEWLKEYQIPLYSIEKQRAIADLFDQIDALIESRKEQKCKLDELVKSRFVELFGDIKELGIRWGEKAFKEVTYNLDSKRKPVKDADRKKMQGKYPYYGATGIVDHVNEYRQEGVFLLISEDGKALEFRNKPIAFIAEGKIWVNNHAHVQQCKPECNMIYLMYYINLIDISAWVTGIDQKKLNRENLDSIPVALPPVDIQEQFATFVAEVDKSKYCRCKSSRLLQRVASI